MATIREIQLKNTKAFLKNYTEKMVDLTKIEIGRKRRRVYDSGRVVNSPIDARGSGKGVGESGRNSITSKEVKNGFEIEGNDYLEDVDEGTSSTIASESDLLKWIERKPVRIRKPNGRLVTMTDYRKNNLARLIKESLAERGIKRTNFLTDLVQDTQSKLDGIENAVVEDIMDNIGDLLVDLGFLEQGETYKLEKKK